MGDAHGETPKGETLSRLQNLLLQRGADPEELLELAEALLLRAPEESPLSLRSTDELVTLVKELHTEVSA
ncbi:hypothetical protein MRY87_06565, partial [bacterium]|nr:hypothetical protein [bacterium]